MNKYPRWLNILAVGVLSIVPMGLLTLILGYRELGLGMLIGGFALLWGFGSWASRMKHRIKGAD